VLQPRLTGTYRPAAAPQALPGYVHTFSHGLTVAVQGVTERHGRRGPLVAAEWDVKTRPLERVCQSGGIRQLAEVSLYRTRS